MRFASPCSVLLVLALTACGGGGGGGGDAAAPGTGGDSGGAAVEVSTTEAFRVLNQATFGATEAEVARVQQLGIGGWIDDQLQQPGSRQLPHLQSIDGDRDSPELQADRVDIWYRNVLYGRDQLRQRVAFALSQIMVVSQRGVLMNGVYALADYYDMLVANAFGNYRDLIEDVTLHPAMGVYLSMLGNEKPDPERNIRPDENYARELMQLFSIGLVELNRDGSEKRDAEGLPLPTYDQSIIEGFSHVYTGWNWAGAPAFQLARPTEGNQVQPMQLYPEFHDSGSKKLLNGVVLPPDQSGQADLAAALDNVFNHPNVGPFMAIRLIQRLVTSNPSPDYVHRVASVFDNDGTGVRGNLGAVVKAILMDPEARPGNASATAGKLKEPILRITQLWRAYEARSNSGRYPLIESFLLFGQGPLQAPSVFNFFSPFYAPAGEIRDAGLVAPELQIATEYQNTLFTNILLLQAFARNQVSEDLRPDDVFIDLTEEMALSADIDALIGRVTDKLLGGEMSETLHAELTRMLTLLPPEPAVLRAAEAVYLVAGSPEYAYQR